MSRSAARPSGCRVELAISILFYALNLLAPGVVGSSRSLGDVAQRAAHEAAPTIQHYSLDGQTMHPNHPSLPDVPADVAAAVRNGPFLRQAARLLSARSPMVAQQCSWDPVSSSCDADDAVNIMYAIQARPASAYLWFLLMTYDRESACGVHETASACNGDKANRCIYFDDILKVIGGSGSSAGSSSSSSSSSSTKSESSDTVSALGLDLAAAFLIDGTSSDTSYDNSMQRLAAVDSQQLRQQLRDQLQQQQQQMQELLQEQRSPDQQHQLPQMDTDAAAPSASSSSSSTSKAQAPPAAAAATAKKKPQASSTLDVMCTSTDLLENYVFTKSAYSNPLQAPLAMHCPGSKASDLIKCMRLFGPTGCKSHPECVFIPGSANGKRPDMCVSKYFNGLKPDQVKKFTFEVTMAEPSVVGSCDGACWMRQAMLCNRTRDAGACIALSFCRYSSSGTCTPRLYTQDNFGSSVQEYMGECVDVDNRRDCESLRLRLVNKGNYGRWQMPKAASWQCSVPSIGRLLGSRTAAAQERGSRLIAAAGAMEERAAELQAAAAAAAAAANAAQLVSGRGPVVLRQIYFQDSRP